MDNMNATMQEESLEEQSNEYPMTPVKAVVNMNDKVLFRYMLLNSTYGIASKIMLTVSLVALVLLPFSFFYSNETTRFALGLIVFLNLILQPLRLKASSKKQMLDNPVFKSPMQYIFDRNGIALKQVMNDGALEWDKILGVKETKYMFLFYINPSQAFIIPKESLENDEDILDLRELVKINFKGVKRLRKK